MTDAKLLDLNAFFEDFRYKPNFGFQISRRGENRKENWLTIVMIVEDSRADNGEWRLQAAPRYESYINDGYFERVLRNESIVGYSPSRPMVEIHGNYRIPLFFDGDEPIFMEWLHRHVREIELHEVDEWFRYKGVLPYDPHKEN